MAALGEPCGPFYGWRADWALPRLAHATDEGVVFGPAPPDVALGEIPAAEVARRVADGHQPFALWLDGAVAAYGWSSSGAVHIGEVDLTFDVPPDQRYLWDFVTLTAHRGRGLYPRLLQEIVRRQAGAVAWFWIGHAPHNTASQRGIRKAGFRRAGDVWRHHDGHLVFVPDSAAEPALVRHASRTLGLPLALGVER